VNKNINTGTQGGWQKIFQGRRVGTTKKRLKISKKYRKMALFSLFLEGGLRKKDRKIAKKIEKSTIKPLQGGRVAIKNTEK